MVGQSYAYDLGLMPVPQVARDLGLTNDAVVKAWRRGRRRIYKQGRVNAVTLKDVEWYVAQREARAPSVIRRPPGWLGINRVTDLLKVTPSTVAALQAKGVLTAVRVGRRYFYEPSAVEAQRLRRTGETPGWVPISDLIAEHGWAGDLPYHHVKRLGLEVRAFTGPRGRPGPSRRLAIRLEGVGALVAAMSAPECYAGHLQTEDMGVILGVTTRTLMVWAKKGCPFQADRRGYFWFDPLAVEGWLSAQKVSPRAGGHRVAGRQAQLVQIRAYLAGGQAA